MKRLQEFALEIGTVAVIALMVWGFWSIVIQDGCDRMDAAARAAGYKVERPNIWTCRLVK